MKCLTNTAQTLTRWYLLIRSPAWSPTKFDEDGLIEDRKQILRNTAKRIQLLRTLLKSGRYRYRQGIRLTTENVRSLIRWILSKYNRLIDDVTEEMDRYDHMKTVSKITELRG